MDNENLNVLRVAASTYPEVVGGVGLHVHHMSRTQAEMGHDVTVLTSDNGDRSLARTEIRDGYKLIRHRELARPVDNTIIPGVIKTLYEDIGQYDVLHIHSHLYFCSNVAAFFARRSGIPTVVTNHGLISQTAPGWIQRAYNPTLGKYTFEAGDRILCYTETDKQRLQNRGIETAISVIPNGVDCSEFKPNGTGSNDQLLFVGRLKEGKGPQYLLEAFAELRSNHPELTLKIVGEGPMHEELERQAETLRIEEQVHLVGEVPNDELPRLYNESTAFVLPSLNEGLPRTVLEAMACGRPVVTSDLEQLRPIVQGAGYTAEPGSAEDLNRSLDKLLNSNGELESFGECARTRMEEHYSWRRTVERTLEAYRAVIEEKATW